MNVWISMVVSQKRHCQLVLNLTTSVFLILYLLNNGIYPSKWILYGLPAISFVIYFSQTFEYHELNKKGII